MSDKENLRRRIVKAVFKRAWRMYKQGGRWIYSFCISLKVAWQIIRGKLFIKHTKVVGVSFCNPNGVNRQKILRKLTTIPQEQIAVYFKREPDNPVDTNAIKVVVTVAGRGAATLGYLNQDLAYRIASEIDSGKIAFVIFEGVTGIGMDNLGCNITFTILDIEKELL